MTIDKITVARYIASRKAPYLVSALFRAPLIATTAVPVAAMDQHGRVYYNPEELENWSPEHIATVLLHELCHWLNAHFERVGTRDPQRWNIAADMEIANILREMDCRLDTPRSHVKPEDYNFPRDLLAEEYYDMLPDNGTGSDDNDDSDSNGNDCSDTSHPSGSASDGRSKLWELPADDTEHPALSEAEQEILRRQVAYDTEQHYKQRGTVPAGLKRLIDELHKRHQVDWRTVLRRVVKSVLITSGIGDQYTYRRPNRRRSGTPFIFPTVQRIRPEVAVVLDTSGSMSPNEMNAALTEVDAILRTIRSQVTVLSVDAAVNKVQKIQHTRTIELVGGGGTDMMIGIRAAAEQNPKPNIIVVITDGYTPWSSTPPKNTPPVVAVLTNADSQQPPAWIHTVRVRLDA